MKDARTPTSMVKRPVKYCNFESCSRDPRLRVFSQFSKFFMGGGGGFFEKRIVKVLYTRKQRIGKFEIAGRAIEDNSTIRYFINQIFGIGNSYES